MGSDLYTVSPQNRPERQAGKDGDPREDAGMALFAAVAASIHHHGRFSNLSIL